MSFESARPYKWIREIINTIPTFDGHNIDVLHFITTCRRIQRLIATQQEADVMKVLMSKLSGDVYAALGEETRTIAELIYILKTAFGSRQTLSDCYAGLKHLQKKNQGEDILRYTNQNQNLARYYRSGDT